jgi:hypothetical protein
MACHGIVVRRTVACKRQFMVALLAHTSNASYSLTNLSWVLVGSLQWKHFHPAVATALRDSSSSCGKRALYRYSIQHVGIPQSIRSGSGKRSSSIVAYATSCSGGVRLLRHLLAAHNVALDCTSSIKLHSGKATSSSSASGTPVLRIVCSVLWFSRAISLVQ